MILGNEVKKRKGREGGASFKDIFRSVIQENSDSVVHTEVDLHKRERIASGVPYIYTGRRTLALPNSQSFIKIIVNFPAFAAARPRLPPSSQ